MKRSTRVLWSYATAVIGLSIIIYLLYEYDLVATIGKFALRWVYLIWEPIAVVLEALWEPIVVMLANVARALAIRPVGRAFSWFFLGIFFHYVLSEKMRARYRQMVEWMREQMPKIIAVWQSLPLAGKVLLIVGGGVLVACLNLGLLLLPLGFFVEPLYRRLRTWVMRESVAGVGFFRAMSLRLYWLVRRLMRDYQSFRALLGPFRWIRLALLRMVRIWHFRYRNKRGGLRETIREWRRQEWHEERTLGARHPEAGSGTRRLSKLTSV